MIQDPKEKAKIGRLRYNTIRKIQKAIAHYKRKKDKAGGFDRIEEILTQYSTDFTQIAYFDQREGKL